MNRLTERSQEALGQAQVIAVRYGHPEVDGEHLLLALLDRPDGLLPRMLQRLEVRVDAFRQRVEGELERRPKEGAGWIHGQCSALAALPG